MKIKLSYIFIIIFFYAAFSSCESDAAREQREAREEVQRIQVEERKERKAIKLEQARNEQEAQEEKKRQEKIIYDKYIDNSLKSGATPYTYCFGGNKTCSEYGCSQIKVRTPSNSDVIVTIKRNDKVFRHAYINAGNQYTFEFPNGTYQAFFYYGKGWNPNKEMKETDCGILKGGFVADEQFSKDSPQSLNNTVLEYELILQKQGNFSTQPSKLDEAF